MNLYRGLVIFHRAEHFALARRNGRVALDQLRHDTTQGLDTQRERSDIEQEYILDLTLEDTGLDGCTNRHYLVRIDAFVGLFAEDLAYQVDYSWHARLSTDQHHLIDIARPDIGIFQCLHDRATCAFDEINDQLLQSGPR